MKKNGGNELTFPNNDIKQKASQVAEDERVDSRVTMALQYLQGSPKKLPWSLMMLISLNWKLLAQAQCLGINDNRELFDQKAQDMDEAP